MLTRRQFLERSLKGTSLVALGATVPQFLASTAHAAEPGKDTILVVIELTGGNDGLNTVIPFRDDLYYKNRPTLGLRENRLVRVNDEIGLNPGLANLGGDNRSPHEALTIIQGVGYPNPDRSHFESMDIWHKADPTRKTGNGWLGRSLGVLQVKEGQIPAMHIGTDKLPLAMTGSATGVPSVHPTRPFDLDLDLRPPIGRPNFGGRVFVEPPAAAPQPPVNPDDPRIKERRKLIEDLAKLTPNTQGDMLQFVKQSSLHTYTTIDKLREITRGGNPNGLPQPIFRDVGVPGGRPGELMSNLNLIARLIMAGFGTRLFYVSTDGYDTHSDQLNQHEQLLRQVADSVNNFFAQLQGNGESKRVLVMTFSEFGRRVKENGSKGTDHGAASCMFLVGPEAKAGVVGKHPKLDDLDQGDLKHAIDFRQVYATLLDQWLECDSKGVLGGKWEHVPILKKMG